MSEDKLATDCHAHAHLHLSTLAARSLVKEGFQCLKGRAELLPNYRLDDCDKLEQRLLSYQLSNLETEVRNMDKEVRNMDKEVRNMDKRMMEGFAEIMQALKASKDVKGDVKDEPSK